MKHSYIPLNRVLTNFFPAISRFVVRYIFPTSFPNYIQILDQIPKKKKKEKMSNAPIRQDEKPPKLWKELITRL